MVIQMSSYPQPSFPAPAYAYGFSPVPQFEQREVISRYPTASAPASYTIDEVDADVLPTSGYNIRDFATQVREHLEQLDAEENRIADARRELYHAVGYKVQRKTACSVRAFIFDLVRSLVAVAIMFALLLIVFLYFNYLDTQQQSRTLLQHVIELCTDFAAAGASGDKFDLVCHPMMAMNTTSFLKLL